VDDRLTSALAATLAGLSITAASFLINMAKIHTDQSGRLREDIKRRQADYDREEKPATKAVLKSLLDEAQQEYKDGLEISKKGPKAVKSLLLAFVAFSFSLVESLSLDPFIEKAVIETVSGEQQELIRQDNIYLTWLKVDIGLSGGSLLIGIGLLCYSAFCMRKLIPKAP
jgi:hypothetical protein